MRIKFTLLIAALALLACSAVSAAPLDGPAWCHVTSGTYCYATPEGADAWIQQLHAVALPGARWHVAGGGTSQSLNVRRASCVGDQSYGSVAVTAANMSDIVNVSMAQVKAWDGGNGWPVGERAYRVLRCALTDGRGGQHQGLYSPSKDGFITADSTTSTAATTGTTAVSTVYVYTDPDELSNAIEQYGVWNPETGAHMNVDSAICLGLRRDGVRTSSDGYTELFRQSKCDLDMANGSYWEGTFVVKSDNKFYNLSDFHKVF